MKKTNKIIFATALTLPSSAAHALNIARVSGALARSYEGKAELWVRKNSKSTSIKDVEEFISGSGVENKINIILLPNNKLLFLIFFAFKLLRTKREGSIIYTRDLALAVFTSIFKYRVGMHLHSTISRTRILNKLLTYALKKRNFPVFPVSNGLKEYLLSELKISTSRVHLVRNGVDINLYKKLKENSSQDKSIKNKITAGYGGHLYKGRGIEIIISLASLMPDIDFLVIGGTQKEFSDILNGKILLNIIHLPHKSFVEATKVLIGTDILLMPYQCSVGVSYGGFHSAKILGPIKMYEYLAMGKPIISSDLSSLREVLTPETTLFARPDDVNSWRVQLEKIINSRELMNKMAKESLLLANHFHVDYQIRDALSFVFNFYDEKPADSQKKIM